MTTRRASLMALAALAACAAPPTAPPVTRLRDAPGLLAPEVPREFRAAWVATVANIDWPSTRGLSAEQQQAEVRALVARAVDLGLNALILQVRTSADALYASPLEPWSEYLTGTQGQDPGYDPLAYWLAQAHAAGLELHAWFNPYRARQANAQSAESATHLSRSRPEWVKRYGKQLWLDPGEPGAAAHTLAVVRDVLTRYAVDGVHIDDYFYPYPEKDAAGNDIDFPDDESFARHGGGLGRAEWRRRNVDDLVKALHALVREVRPNGPNPPRLGISPFGLMKPSERPAGIQGFSQYDKLHADVERWLTEGWLDYLVPQLYWPRAQTAQAFGPLLSAWMRLNPRGRHVWPGLFTSRIVQGPAGAEPPAAGDARSWMPEEISGQVTLARSLNPDAGHVHFSMVALSQNRRGVADHLKAQIYAQPALPPASPWLREPTPPALRLLHVQPVGGAEAWRLEGAPDARRLWLWWRVGHGSPPAWRAQVLGPQQSFNWPADATALVASAFSPSGIEGPRRAWSLEPS